MRILTLLFILFAATAVCGQSKADLTAAEILDASIAFCGGEKRLADLESSSLNYLLIQPDQSTATVIEKRKTGKQFMQSTLAKDYVPQTTFSNGSKWTVVNGGSIIHTEEAAALEAAQLKTFSQIPYGYKILGYELTRLPDKQFKHMDCYVLDVKAPDGYITTNYFDKTNFRLTMIIYPNGNKSLVTDYTFKDSILYNKRILNTFRGSDEIQEFRLRSIQANEEIADLWFECPYTDNISTPSHIKTGTFESTNGSPTLFKRTDLLQEYLGEEGQVTKRLHLQWINPDTFSLIKESALKEKEIPPGAQFLVRIISWDDKNYVCHWLVDQIGGTQDYQIK